MTFFNLEPDDIIAQGLPPEPGPDPIIIVNPLTGLPADINVEASLIILQEDQRSALGILKQTADTGTADTEYTVTHNLGYVPDHFLVVSVDKGAVIYKSATAWTSNAAYFKASVANTNVWVALG